MEDKSVDRYGDTVESGTPATPKYPIGIQSFESLIREGYVYVDKTNLIYRLVNQGSYYFLSRPRRFGKSLLLSTIEAYFRGKRELFRGLAIDRLTEDWEPHPVLHLDLNIQKYDKPDDINVILDYFLKKWESEYEVTDVSDSMSLRFANVIEAAHEKTGRRVVILVDEYDKPLTETLLDDELSDKFRDGLRAFFGNLKTQDRHIRFAMLTGVTRFSRMTIFSGINNLKDISMSGDYEAICGITHRELTEYFSSSIQTLAQKKGITAEKTKSMLRDWYDGYQFSEVRKDVYNPFSLLNAFSDLKIGTYWFRTATPLFLVRLLAEKAVPFGILQEFEADIQMLSEIDSFRRNPISLLFQTGYLTIHHYDEERNECILGYPNREVKESFAGYLYKYLVESGDNDFISEQRFSISRFEHSVKAGDAEDFMQRFAGLFATLNLDPRGNMEAHYQNVVYLLFTLLGFRSGIEVHSSHGRSDLIVETQKYVYIFEFKVDSSAEAAIRQIEEKGYSRPYIGTGREVMEIGVSFDTSTRALTPWLIRRS